MSPDPRATLPQAALGLLERRYLDRLQAGWEFRTRPGDTARPLLFEVVETARAPHPETWLGAMPAVLRAAHEPGHAPVLVLLARAGRHRLFVGARRLIGGGGRCTEDYLGGLGAAVRAEFPGVRLAPAARLDPAELPDVYDFIQTAPALAAVTGIPSRRPGGAAAEAQAPDRIARAALGHDFLLMVAAEPLDPDDAAAAADACRRLKGEMHGLVRRTESTATGDSTTTGGPVATPDRLPHQLGALAVFCQLTGLHAAAAAGRVATMLLAPPPAAVPHESTGRTRTETTASERLDATAEFCERVLQDHHDRLRAGRAGGWWRAAVYLAGADEAALYAAAGAVRSACGGPATPLDPIRVVRPPAGALRPAIEAGQVLGLKPAAGADPHPLGRAFDALATCVGTDELAVPFNLPRDELPGLPMRDRGGFALTAPGDGPVRLGQVFDRSGRDLGPLTLTPDSLNRHVFVTGMTGYGKSTTCTRLLVEAHDRLKVPFLVIEPAKAEYGRLAGAVPRLRVYGIGPSAPHPLRLNPLAPLPGMPIGRYIDLLKAVFNASFPMAAGMPYVLEEAMIDLYRDRGWSLHTGGNDHAAADPALYPTLAELHDQVEVVLARKRYAQEVHQNMGAALRSRLRSLMVGNKGLALNARRPTPPRDLFDRPAVVQLQDLGDDEEKAFVMALLFVNLYGYAEGRPRSEPGTPGHPLRHLTLIEEAHRLLSTPHAPASAEVGNPQAKAVRMFTDMLAEVRAYGEGFVIADQIPTALAPETLKNTNLKLVHRLTAPDDRAAVGRAINLTDWQVAHLNTLPPGQAVVHDERIGDAVLVRIEPVAVPPVPPPAAPDPGAREYLYRDAGCRGCRKPCEYLPAVEDAPPDLFRAAAPVFDELLLGGADRAWDSWAGWRARVRALAPPRLAAEPDGVVFCAAARAAHDWLGRVLADRRRDPADPAPALTPDDRLKRERVAHGLADWLRDWAPRPRLDADARAAFAAARRALNPAAAAPPRGERPGCAGCPVRCRMLPLVNRLDNLAKHVPGVAAALTAAGDRLAAVGRYLGQIEAFLPELARLTADDPTRLGWRYCALVQLPLPEAAAAGRDEALAGLRDRVRGGAD